MASIRESKGEGYLVLFRYGGRQYQRKLGTDDQKEAEARRKRLEATIHDLSTGRLKLPDDCQDVGTFILSDGRATGKAVPAQHVTLKELWDIYLSDSPENVKEASTMVTEGVHFRHMLRLLKPGTAVPLLTTADLQRYIKARSLEDGIREEKIKSRTIRKEIGTFEAVWNKFALPHKLVKEDFKMHFGTLVYSKERSKPPFRTYDEIKDQLPGKTAAEQANLWDCLFLQRNELEQVIGTLQHALGCPAWLYPMALMAAHTGCRRSELMRAEPEDFNLANGVVHVREKKRNKNKEFTYRPVPLSTRLVKVLSEWKATRQPGEYMFGNLTPKVVHTSLQDGFKGSQWTVIRGWHIFRHSLASIMAMEGKDQRMIDSILGHTTEQMRLRYQHLSHNKQKAALDSIFG